MREAGFRGLIRFEFIEKRRQFRLLILRQNGENPLLRRVFPCLLRFQVFLVIRIGVPCVDLDNVMDQAHQHHFADVHLFVGIFPQQVCHDRHMPGMLRVVFPPPVSGKMRLPENILFLVDFQRKSQLFFQAFLHRCTPLRI